MKPHKQESAKKEELLASASKKNKNKLSEKSKQSTNNSNAKSLILASKQEVLNDMLADSKDFSGSDSGNDDLKEMSAKAYKKTILSDVRGDIDDVGDVEFTGFIGLGGGDYSYFNQFLFIK